MSGRFQIIFLTFLLATLGANAAVGGRDLAYEAKIETELRQLNADLVDPFQRARVAMDKGDFAEAVNLLRPICTEVPSFSPALRRLGWSLSQQGNSKEGLALVEKAASQDTSGESLITLASVLAFPPKGEANQNERRRALGALAQIKDKPAGQGADALIMTAQLSLSLDRPEDARDAVTKLAAHFPGLMQTHYFSAIIAAMDEHWIRARSEILRAGELGLSDEVVNKFLASGVESRATAWHWAELSGWVIGAWAAGLLGLFLTGAWLSGATLRQIEVSESSVPVSEKEHRLRRIYRVVMNVAGIYYYISLPIVLVMVIGVAAALVFGCMMVGYLPIKLLIIVVIGAIATIWTMGRSLILRVEAQDPGRELVRDDAEGLWRLTEDVAHDLGTKPIDEIRITAGTDLCVYERGTWRQKIDNRAKRVLVLGAAVLNGFKLDDFRSVLAHEYGHFANRDTAGGDIALRVQNDMVKFFYAMVNAGQATRLNVAFHFLRLYNFLFRRISHGATRLQEVLADRVAAQTYGARAFEEGLRHVIRQSIEFGATIDREVDLAVTAKRPLQNLYDLPSAHSASHEAEFELALNRPTSKDDTHPGPKDRFRLVNRVPEPQRGISSGFVWDLFKDRDAIAREMTGLVEKQLISHRSAKR